MGKGIEVSFRGGADVVLGQLLEKVGEDQYETLRQALVSNDFASEDDKCEDIEDAKAILEKLSDDQKNDLSSRIESGEIVLG